MAFARLIAASLAAAALAVAGCSGNGGNRSGSGGGGGLFAGSSDSEGGSTVWDLFGNNNSPDTAFQVNRYIWNASLDVLDFLPLETVEPFTGVIETGWGRPPNGRAEYRVTVLIKDPALDARALSVSVYDRSGPVDADVVEEIENAILSRARQLRKADSEL